MSNMLTAELNGIKLFDDGRRFIFIKKSKSSSIYNVKGLMRHPNFMKQSKLKCYLYIIKIIYYKIIL